MLGGIKWHKKKNKSTTGLGIRIVCMWKDAAESNTQQDLDKVIRVEAKEKMASHPKLEGDDILSKKLSGVEQSRD